MPSKSPAQARLMAACAHGAHYPGCPHMSVAKEFNQADKGTGIMSKQRSSSTANYAQGGAVIGKVSEFMKTPDEFRDPDHANAAADADQIYGKGGGGQASGSPNPAAKNKQLPKIKGRG